MPSYFPEGDSPRPSDDEFRSLQKLVSLGSTGTTGRSGAGSPQGVVTAPVGTTYVDTTSGDLWVKQTGTGNTGWVLATSVAAATGVFAGNGDPTGVVVPTTAGAIYVQIDSDPPGIIWEFYSGAWH